MSSVRNFRLASSGISTKAVARDVAGAPLYSEELGINLRSRTDREYFKWFLASILFGARISETIAGKTYRTFERHDLLTPEDIVAAGWPFLVSTIMYEGGYVRYDGRKSTQIIRNCDTLITEYGGSLKALHRSSSGPSDLEARLRAFFGIGPVTMNIFLRELRPYWWHADPLPLPEVQELARRFGFDLGTCNRKTVAFTRLEAGLIRLRHQHKRLKANGRPQ